MTKTKNLRVIISLPDRCWGKPDARGHRYLRKDQFTNLADGARWMVRELIQTAVETAGGEWTHASGGQLDFDIPADADEQSFIVAIAKAAGGYEMADGTYPDYQFNYSPELIHTDFIPLDAEGYLLEGSGYQTVASQLNYTKD
jgi:hypothetical protein